MQSHVKETLPGKFELLLLTHTSAVEAIFN
jgi:hypothetical protein